MKMTEKLQENLLALERWEKDWLVEFHTDKCSVMLITRKNSEYFSTLMDHHTPNSFKNGAISCCQVFE